MGRRIIFGLLLFLSQVVIFKDLVLFDHAFCLPYILILLVLPFNANRVLLLISGMFLGLMVDMFYDTPGINAAACVLIMFLRPFWLDTLLSGSNYDSGTRVNIRNMGFRLFSVYILPLTLMHHFTLFFLEAGGFGLMGITFVKVLYTTAFTFVTMIILQYIFASENRVS